MPHGFDVLKTHPHPPHATLEDCIKACLDCWVACTACADACLAEKDPTGMAACIRQDIACATVCAATAQVLIQSASLTDHAAVRAQLEAGLDLGVAAGGRDDR